MISDHDRRDLFAILSELACRYPHWRVGQLVTNVAGWADAEVWDVDDAQLLAAARAHLMATPGPLAPAPGPNVVAGVPQDGLTA